MIPHFRHKRQRRPHSWKHTSLPWTREPPAPGPSCSTGPGRSSPAPSTPSARSTPSPAGWSTIRWKSGPRRSGPWRRSWAPPTSTPSGSPPWASPTSGRPPSSGTAPPGSRSATPSYGSAAGPLPLCDTLKADGLGPLVAERTGLLIDAYFSGTKIRWLLDHVPGARERAERGELCAGTVDSWLIWNLTGGAAHVTDYSNASRTMLFNIHTLQWDEALCRALGIPASPAAGAAAQLPSLRPCGPGHSRTGGSGGHPHLRQRRGPAGGPVRPGLLHAGPGEEHLRHRLLHADECGR